MSSQTSDRVERMILEAIDESLSILGDKGKEAVYYFLEREYCVNKEDIPKNLKTFLECLRLVFGVGANIIEKYILNNLRKRACLELKLDYSLNLMETVERIKVETK
ncbi:MAG: hypothetical protein QXQ24_04490 [Nitrososphaeria archaeon]